MKTFRNLWYTGLTIVGIPVALVIVGLTLMVVSKDHSTLESISETEMPKVDTVFVEKRVVVRDTVYIKPKPTPKPVVTVQDTL